VGKNDIIWFFFKTACNIHVDKENFSREWASNSKPCDHSSDALLLH